MRRLVPSLLLVLGLAAATGTARANIQVGQSAPNFTKNKLGGGSVSFNSYSGKIVVLFLLGFD